jgi:hypothetical protein
MVVDLCGYEGVHITPQHVLGEVECLSLLIVALLSLGNRLLGIACLYLLCDLATLTPLSF